MPVQKKIPNKSMRFIAQIRLRPGGGGGVVLPYSLGGGVPLGSRKSYPLQSLVSDPVKRDPILYQFSMITKPFTRPNGLKTTPFQAALTHIANIWEYPPPPLPGNSD